ncbi:hypothetical protein [Gymnodinialimonas hymeniacidonis]|uniref:hypothetical protein n=1 Tax=Gymnodinialimonas hymeniacidonis TaxID=3126508 RepID=UPI0034C681AF
MARAADGVPPGPEDDPEDDSAFTLTNALRFVEGLAFCCLATLMLVWAVDRSRNIDFDPVTVQICEGEACSDTPEDYGDRVWSQYTDTLDLHGLTVFSSANTCAFAADVLQNRATEESVDRMLDLIQSRGTITMTRPGDGTATIAPGPNNDGFGDILRDAIRWQAPRGCHPMNYTSVFWPLWAVWMLLINWRLFRYGQSVWASRDS